MQSKHPPRLIGSVLNFFSHLLQNKARKLLYFCARIGTSGFRLESPQGILRRKMVNIKSFYSDRNLRYSPKFDSVPLGDAYKKCLLRKKEKRIKKQKNKNKKQKTEKYHKCFRIICLLIKDDQ